MFEPEVLFSSSVDGRSLTNLFYHCGQSHPLLLIIRVENNIFGAFTTDAFHMSNKFYGTGETFLFSLTPPRKYAATMKNNFFVSGRKDILSRYVHKD